MSTSKQVTSRSLILVRQMPQLYYISAKSAYIRHRYTLNTVPKWVNINKCHQTTHAVFTLDQSSGLNVSSVTHLVDLLLHLYSMCRTSYMITQYWLLNTHRRDCSHQSKLSPRSRLLSLCYRTCAFERLKISNFRAIYLFIYLFIFY